MMRRVATVGMALFITTTTKGLILLQRRRIVDPFWRRSSTTRNHRKRRFGQQHFLTTAYVAPDHGVDSMIHGSSDTSMFDEEENITSLQQNGMLSASEKDIAHLGATWRQDPRCNPTIAFPAWICPGPNIQSILRSPLTQPYLAIQLSILDHLHVRFKVVRSCISHTKGVDDDNTPNKNSNHSNKMILLHPDTTPISTLPEPVRNFLANQKCQDADTSYSVPFQYHQFTASFLLNQLLPVEVHPVPTAFEMVGHVAHLNLRAPHIPYRFLIGEVLLETIPTIETVIQKVGEVTGPYRTFDYELLAGRNSTQVNLTESGVSLQFDLQNVYWCSRLSEERQRLLKDEIFATDGNDDDDDKEKTDISQKTIVLADVFCGVGALLLQAALQPGRGHRVEIWANDWNPHATEALRANALANGVTEEQLTRVTTQDAYDCLMDLGTGWATATSVQSTTPPPPLSSLQRSGKRRRRTSSRQASVARRPDHVVMNFPLEAPQFLGALRWWTPDDHPTRFHVYTFARETDDRSVEEVAIDLIAHNLLPRPMAEGSRKGELDEEYQCRVRTHVVRDVAPGKVVVCVSFTVTPKLLRHMRGDYL